MQVKLVEIKETLYRILHVPASEQGRWLGQVVRGCLAYHAVPTNARAVHYVTWEAGAWLSEPKGAGEVGTNGANRRVLATICPHPSSLSATTFHRAAPKVGAEALASACPGARGNPRPLSLPGWQAGAPNGTPRTSGCKVGGHRTRAPWPAPMS
jgi:hypothetical protein